MASRVVRTALSRPTARRLPPLSPEGATMRRDAATAIAIGASATTAGGDRGPRRRWMAAAAASASSPKGKKGAKGALSAKRRKERSETEAGIGGGGTAASAMGTARTGLLLDPPLNDDSAAELPAAAAPRSLLRHDLSPYSLPLASGSSDPLSASNPPVSPLQTLPPPLHADESGLSKADPSDVLDMKSLYDPSVHLPDKPDFNVPLRDGSRFEPSTPLCEEIVAYIGVRGPITVAEYMRMALRHPTYGYYAGSDKKGGQDDDDDDLFDDDEEERGAAGTHEPDDDWDEDRDAEEGGAAAPSSSAAGPSAGPGSGVIGPRGDFTTAPEISQLFGEMIAVWLCVQWRDLGKPSAARLVEIGPGRGTLVCDVLRSASQLLDGEFVKSLARGRGGGGVHLVEVGRGMRSEQRDKLAQLEKSLAEGGGEEGAQGEGKGEGGAEVKFAFGSLDGSDVEDDPLVRELRERAMGRRSDKAERKEVKAGRSSAKPEDGAETASPNEDDPDAISVTWHDDLLSVPASGKDRDRPVPVFIVCQELIDALPIHVFQKTEDGWRERLVDVAVREEEPEHVAKSGLAGGGGGASGGGDDAAAKARSKFVRAESDEKAVFSDPAGGKRLRPRLRFVLPPDTTPAVRTLLNVDGSGRMTGPAAHLDDSRPGDVLEVCPEGMMLVQDMASLIRRCGGAALVVDYGGEGSGDTLRAFKRHGQVHVLSEPGRADVTADVDFAALRGAVNDGGGGGGGGGSGSGGAARRSAASDGGKAGDAPETAAAEEEEVDPNPPLAFGPVSQGQFLHAMGITDRVVQLVERDSTTIEQANELMTAMERLVTPENMGDRYKVMAIARKKDGIFAPPPF